MSHRAIMHLSGQERFFFTIAIKRSLAAQREHNLAIFFVLVQSACSPWFQNVAHNAALVVYKGEHEHFSMSTLKTNYLGFFQIIQVDVHNLFIVYIVQR